jgi:hypothetical protein
VSVLVALAVGLVFWISAWALGMKSFDAFMVTAGLTLAAATARIAAPFVARLRGRES